MADFLEDIPFARQCRKLLHAGSAWVREHLFNGEYFIQETDWMEEGFLRRFCRPDHSDSAWEKYWDPIHKSVKYQLGSGCAIDQHLGQWHCSLYGLGNVLDPRQVKSATVGNHEVDLFPKESGSDIKSVRLTISRRTYLPVKIVFSLSDGTAVIIVLSHTKGGANYPASTFMFEKNLVPAGTPVIDLR